MKIAITGANGYIGARLVSRALTDGHSVVALVRRPLPRTDVISLAYDLSSKFVPPLPDDTNIIIHLAANTVDNAGVAREELHAAQLLIEAARKHSAALIFVSSQTSRADAPTQYGRTKWQIEQIILAAGGSIVRPGQVYGGVQQGLFGQLVNTTARLPAIPHLLPGPQVQPIHIDDLITGLLRIATAPEKYSRLICLAAPKTRPFSEFLNQIAVVRLRVYRPLLPVPAALLLTAFKLLRKTDQAIRFQSLLQLPVMETKADLQSLQLELRDLRLGMHRSGNSQRRLLLLEGNTFFRYILSQSVPLFSIRKYVRVIMTLRNGHPLHLPQSFHNAPFLLALIDKGVIANGNWHAELTWRLDAATLIGEASTIGARSFLGIPHSHGMLRSVLAISATLVAETLWRLLSLSLSKLITKYLLPSFED
ncbi:NAD-dependent epimerase/dehydratase family protein [Undibacterium sp. Dicai25W]|uniref:NAD-dependent epimerase/dehydratase family protein n=1 Tax=Undibacterium sp. Dicai25W TaxID=3413034 RepID=UPI003BF07E4B